MQKRATVYCNNTMLVMKRKVAQQCLNTMLTI